MGGDRDRGGAGQAGRWGALVVLGLAACEVLIMISPFAGFFYAGLRFEPLLGLLSQSALTGWLDGFFLNHAAVTRSAWLEGQRELGQWLFALGGWGFLVCAAQVYGNKLLGRGVVVGGLYRFSRHPQYLCLALAGAALLTFWPRFLLLGLFVTMLFLYAGLARFEERRMEERFGEAYLRFAETRGAFLPGSPVRRLFEASFGRIRPTSLGWASSYACCLALAFGAAAGLRGYTRSQTAILERPHEGAVVVSAWPQPDAWVERIYRAALEDAQVARELRERGRHPLVVTILPPRYVMKGMYYSMPRAVAQSSRDPLGVARRIGSLAARFLVPVPGWTRPSAFMGVDPDDSHLPVEVVISSAERPWSGALSVTEALDPGVRLEPLLVVDVTTAPIGVADVRTPLSHNRWGPGVVMPVF